MKHSLIFLAVVECLAGPVFAAETSSQTAPPGNRYLFIVDTSSAMKRLAGPTRDYMFDLVFTGLDGQMKIGDSFGLWVFGEATLTDFPMQVWDPHTSFYAAAAATVFLMGQRHDQPPDTGQVLRKAASVIRSVKDVTVLIVSDGSQSVKGTPFDREINQVFAQEARGPRRPALPYVTVLVARDGVIEDWRVIPPGQPLEVPQLPKQAEVAEASRPSDSASKTNEALPATVAANKTPALSKSSAPPPQPAATTNSTVGAPDLVEKPKVVIRTDINSPEEPVATEKNAAEAAAKAVQPADQTVLPAETKPAAQVAETKPLPAPAPTKTEESSSTTPTLDAANKPAPGADRANVLSPPIPPESNPSAQGPLVTVVKAELKPADIPAASSALTAQPPEPSAPLVAKTDVALSRPIRANQESSAKRPDSGSGASIQAKRDSRSSPEAKAELGKTNAATPNLAVAIPERSFNATTLLIAGLALLFVAGLLGWFLLRRVRGAPQPSLISQSMDQRPK